MQNPTLVQAEQQRQMCDALHVEAQSARSEKPHLSSSCDAIVAPACTSSDDAACVTTSNPEDAAPFCIRGYAAAVREINISKCWPFSRQLLEESIREGKHPLLPPLSPIACAVNVIPEYYQDGTGHSTHEDMDEACVNDGPQLQVQIDLSKFEAELDSHGCAAGACGPAKPLNLSVETAPLQEPQEPCTSLLKEAAKHGSLFGDCPLVFKRQAPRWIREIRNSIMQGCQCSKIMGVAQACRKECCGKSSILPPTPADVKSSSLDAFDGKLEGLDKKGIGDHENVSGITQLEPLWKRPYDSQGVAYSHGEMQKDVNYTNKQPDTLAASLPLTSQVDVCGNAALGKDMPAHTRSENTYRRCSVSDSQSVDKSHESHNLRSSNSRQCWDTTTQQDSPDSIACLDNVSQQRCPVCLLFQSSSNTALNVHIDRCLAASSMEEGTSKSKQKVKVRKKRSMAELCLVAPSSIVGGENTNESTISDCNIKSQKSTRKAAAENKDKTIKKQNEVCKPKSKVNTFKLLQWGSRSSSRHGASRRGRIHEARAPRMKNQSFQGRTLEWRTTSVLRNSKTWKRQKTNHEPVAELPHNAQHAPEEKTQKLRKLIQRNKRVQNQNIGKDAYQKGNSAPQSMINKVSNKLHGKFLPKHKTAASRAVLQPSEKHSSKSSKETSHALTSDAHMTITGSQQKTVEVLCTDNVGNAELDQGDKTKEKVKLRVHIHPTRKHKKKRKQKTRASLQEVSDLQLAIIKNPSVSQKVCNAECQSVRPDSPLKQYPTQAHSGIAEGSLETQMLSQLKLFRKGNCNSGNSRRIAEERSVQDPSLSLLPPMMEDHQGERRKPLNYRKVQASSSHNSASPCLTCKVLQSNRRGLLTYFGDMNDIDATVLPLGAQPKTKASLRNNSAAFAPDAWHSRQKEMEQIQVNDSQQAQVSHFLSTTSPNNNSVSMKQFARFPFSLSTTETPACRPRRFEEQNLLTEGSEGLNSSLPSHFIQSLEVAKRTFGTSFTSQDYGARQESSRHDTCMKHTGRHFSALQKDAEAHQYNPGSTQSIFHKDFGSAQIPSFPGSSSNNTWQAHNHSQRLPPWMEAAIHDQRSPAFSSMGLSTNSSCQSLSSNATPNISPEMSRTLSMFEMIGSPVLRLMGKTMVLMPDTSQGHVDINTGQLSSQSTYINFFQSLEPEEATYEAQSQLNRNQSLNLQMQPGIQPEYLASDEFVCRSKEVQSWTTSESRPVPQLQDFFRRTPSSSHIPSTHQQTNSQNNSVNIAEQDRPLLRGSSQLLSAMSHRAQLNWQHQRATSSPLHWPQSSSCCPHNQMRTNLESSKGGGQCNNFRSNLTLPQAPGKFTHNMNNVKTGNSSNVPSWFSSTVNRANTSQQPAKLIILDEDGPLCSFNMSASGPLGQGITAQSKQPEVSAAQQNSTSAECRSKFAELCRPAREKPNGKTFIPIIYTMGGNSVELPIFPGSVGPNAQKSPTTAHEQRQVKSYGTVMNPRKRARCVEQPGDGGKQLKTSESVAPARNVRSRNHGKACSLGPFESRNCTTNPTPLRAASEWMQNTALSGSISVAERLNGRDPSSLRAEQNVVQGQLESNVCKETRLRAPTVGMCSTNMNPAEVDCQDAVQFTLTPTLDIISEPSPANNAQACMDMNVSMCPHPGVPTQKPKCLKWPIPSSTVTTALSCAGFEPSVALPSSTSLPGQNIVSQSFSKKAASKKKNSLPIIYDSSKPPSFCVSIPVVNQQCSLLPEGMAQEFVSPAIQPILQASALNQEMHSFKAARKFVIMNGRVSIMDTQRNKGLVHENGMQKEKRLVCKNGINMQRAEDIMQSNRTDNEVRNANGRNEHVPDVQQQHGSRAKVLGIGKASARGCNDEHEAVAATTELMAPLLQDGVCESCR